LAEAITEEEPSEVINKRDSSASQERKFPPRPMYGGDSPQSLSKITPLQENKYM
jgi:hypothetical protein